MNKIQGRGGECEVGKDIPNAGSSLEILNVP